MRQVTGTLISYYFYCKRRMWLHANGINMEHTSDLVYDGKLIHETSYPQRTERYEEIEIDGIKIDYYDERNKVIHEIKRSDKVEEAHVWQVKYYINVLEQNGLKGVSGLLEYPTLRQTTQVELTDADRQRLAEMVKEIERIIRADNCPPVPHSKICKNCSYYDFCFVKEE
jgi:CRISPR-associated exonuclease Cas4